MEAIEAVPADTSSRVIGAENHKSENQDNNKKIPPEKFSEDNDLSIETPLIGWTCNSCGTVNSTNDDKCTNKKCGIINENLEVKNEDQICEYSTFQDFKNEIVRKAYQVSANTLIRKKYGKDKNWHTLDAFSKGTVLEKFVHPVWASSMEFIVYGIFFMVLLKAIDTTVTMFYIHTGLGLFWSISILLFIAGAYNKVSILLAVGAIIFMQIKFGVQFNIFFTFFTIMVIGTVLGVPLGMSVGTIVGLIREKQGKKLFDAKSEKRFVIVKGFVIPVILFGILMALYILVLNPMIIDWLEK